MIYAVISKWFFFYLCAFIESQYMISDILIFKQILYKIWIIYDLLINKIIIENFKKSNYCEWFFQISFKFLKTLLRWTNDSISDDLRSLRASILMI